MTDKVRILGFAINNKGLAGEVEEAWKCISARKMGHYMACANPHSLVVANRDEEMSRALKGADILLPDGMGIVLAGAMLGTPIRERVTGNEFFLAVTGLANANRRLRYFFLGSTDNVLGLIERKLEQNYPLVEVCGRYSPPFKNKFDQSENEQMLTIINAANPDVLWVGMTAPKQEKWIYNNRTRLDVPFIAAIGAVFDYYAGTKYRAPAWVCQLGLEWLPRFILEPRRLWRRNLMSTPVFILNVLKQKCRGNLPT